MRTVVIPARGGSKGIPRKNLCRVGGETLIARAVRIAKEAGHVIVSTDSHEITIAALQAGAEVHHRSAELSTDDAQTVDVLRAVRDEYKITGTMALLQCTAPLTTTGDIVRCMIRLEAGTADMVVACHAFHGLVLDDDGNCINHQLVPVPRRQEMGQQWMVSGSVWAFDASHLDGDLYEGKVDVIESANPLRLDVDTLFDLALASDLIEGSMLYA